MESIMLNTLGFHLTVPTALRFTERFLKIARATEVPTSFSSDFLHTSFPLLLYAVYLDFLFA
jgi:hypothetical protein